MKGLIDRALRLLMDGLRGMAAGSQRRMAAKSIVKVEADGGYLLKCGCLVHVKPTDLRRMMENFGPEIVLEVELEVASNHEHAGAPARRSWTRKPVGKTDP